MIQKSLFWKWKLYKSCPTVHGSYSSSSKWMPYKWLLACLFVWLLLESLFESIHIMLDVFLEDCLLSQRELLQGYESTFIKRMTLYIISPIIYHSQKQLFWFSLRSLTLKGSRELVQIAFAIALEPAFFQLHARHVLDYNYHIVFISLSIKLSVCEFVRCYC